MCYIYLIIFSNLASQQVERKERLRRLEESLTTMGLSEEKKAEVEGACGKRNGIFTIEKI